MNIIWPTDVLPPRKVTVDPVYATISAGRAITGVEQVVAGDAGYWGITLDEIPFVSRTQKQAARALSVQINGRLGLVDVPIWDSNPLGTTIIDLVPWSDGTTFSDGTQFSQDMLLGVEVLNSVALGAVAMTLQMLADESIGLEPGMHFSVLSPTSGYQRLFRIKTSTLVTTGEYSVTVWPPTREAIAAGSSADFNDPRCTCRLKTDAEFMTFVDDYAGRTLAKVDFEEALP